MKSLFILLLSACAAIGQPGLIEPRLTPQDFTNAGVRVPWGVTNKIDKETWVPNSSIQPAKTIECVTNKIEIPTGNYLNQTNDETVITDQHLVKMDFMTTKWLQSPVTVGCKINGTNADGSPQSWEDESVLRAQVEPVEIGLRSDGVVVWRELK